MGNAKSKKAVVQYFEQSALKVLLPIAEFKALTMKFNVHKFQDGQEICTIGQPCQIFYMAGTGTIALFLADDSGQLMEVTRCSPGMGINPEVLQTGTAQVTAKAIGAVTCFTLHQKKWDEWSAIYQSSAQRVLATFQPKVNDMFREFPIVSPELLSEKQIQYLSRLLHLEVHHEGTVVYQQYNKPPSSVGDPSKNPAKINPPSPTNDGKVYIVHDGVYEAYKKPEDDKQPEVKLGDCTKRGEYFGAIALFMLASRTETVKAVKPSLSFSLSKDDLFSFIQRYPDVRVMYVNALKQIMPDHFASSKNLLFEGVPEDQFGPLLQACEWSLYHPDQVVFREGDVGDSFYIVLFGDLGVWIKKEGKEVKVKTLGAGEYFGEIALVTDKPRTATIKCHSEVALLSMTKESFEEVFASAPEFLSNFQIKLAPANVELKHILWHSYGLECFVKQMQAEYSEENIMFWKDCRAFEELEPGSQAQKDFVEQIFNEYIKNGARMMINLKGLTKQALVKDIKDGNIHENMFKKAMEEVFTLMERDSFARFKSGPHFAAFLKQVGAYDAVAELAQTRMEVTPVASPAARRRSTIQQDGSASPRLSHGLKSGSQESVARTGSLLASSPSMSKHSSIASASSLTRGSICGESAMVDGPEDGTGPVLAHLSKSHTKVQSPGSVRWSGISQPMEQIEGGSEIEQNETPPPPPVGATA